MSRQEISNNIAAAARSPASSYSLQRQPSLLLKRDSAVSLDQAGSTSDVDVRRLSVGRSFQSSEEEAAYIEDDLAAFLAEQPSDIAEPPSGNKQPPGTMGPVYRLVCWLFVMPLSTLPLIPKAVDDNDACTPSSASRYRSLSMLAALRGNAVASTGPKVSRSAIEA